MFENPLICVRNASEDDIPFYASMLRDIEWMANSGYSMDDFQTDEKILQFISINNTWDIKWVVINKSDNSHLGFCHFKQKDKCRAETDGGIVKHMMNTFLGVYSYVQCIDWYFQKNLCQELLSVIYEKNIRSLKMNQSLGFRIAGERYYDIRHFYELILLKKDFYQSPIAQRFIKNK